MSAELRGAFCCEVGGQTYGCLLFVIFLFSFFRWHLDLNV